MQLFVVALIDGTVVAVVVDADEEEEEVIVVVVAARRYYATKHAAMLSGQAGSISINDDFGGKIVKNNVSRL